MRYKVAVLSVAVLISCKDPARPDTEPPRVAVASPRTGESLSGITPISFTATDNSGVTRLDVIIDGFSVATLEGPPWQYQWNTLDATDGAHTIQATGYDGAGNVGNSQVVSVTVANPYSLVIYNTTFTPVDITLQNQSTTIPVGAGVTFVFQGQPSSVSYQASTSGLSTSNVIIGVPVTWNYTIAPTHAHADTLSLYVGSSAFFMRITNSGVSTLTPLYVNFGLTSQTVDNIAVPPNGVTYNTGYYPAHANTEVRLYLAQAPTSYVYWDQGIHFSLPFTANQLANLASTAASPPANGSSRVLPSGVPGGLVEALRERTGQGIRIVGVGQAGEVSGNGAAQGLRR